MKWATGLKLAGIGLVAIACAYLLGRYQGAHRVLDSTERQQAVSELTQQGFAPPASAKPTVPALPPAARPLVTVEGSVLPKPREYPGQPGMTGAADTSNPSSPPSAVPGSNPLIESRPWPAPGDLACKGRCELVQAGDVILGRFSCGASLWSEDRTTVIERPVEPAGQTELRLASSLSKKKRDWWVAVRAGGEIRSGGLRPEVGFSAGAKWIGAYGRVGFESFSDWTVSSGSVGIEFRF